MQLAPEQLAEVARLVAREELAEAEVQAEPVELAELAEPEAQVAVQLREQVLLVAERVQAEHDNY